MVRRPMRVNHAARAAVAEARRASTHARLLDAAERAIAEKGVDACSIEDFVRAAGVARGTFYNYFPAASDLIHALNQRVAAHMTRVLEHHAARPVDPARRLAGSLHSILTAYQTDPVRAWVALQLASSRAPRLRVYEEAFEAVFREGQSVGYFREIDMTAAYTVCFGAIRMAQRDAVAGAPGARPAQVVALLLAALGVPHDEAEQISREEALATPPG